MRAPLLSPLSKKLNQELMEKEDLPRVNDLVIILFLADFFFVFEADRNKTLKIHSVDYVS